MVLLEFSMFPLDKGESLSPYVARCLEIVDRSGLDYRCHAMGTTLEGDFEVIVDGPVCFSGPPLARGRGSRGGGFRRWPARRRGRMGLGLLRELAGVVSPPELRRGDVTIRGLDSG